MLFQLTNAGIAALESAVGPVELSQFKLGSSYGYIPSPTQTDIQGALVFNGQPSDAVLADTPNLIKYTVKLDYLTGPFSYGEIGLFMPNGQMFACGVFDTLQQKEAQGTPPGSDGESVRFDVYVQTDGNYAIWLETAETSNQFRMAVLRSLNDLPMAKDAIPNAYIVQGEDSQQSAFLAYTDRNALWNFDAYAYSYTRDMPSAAVSLNSVSVAVGDWDPQMNPAYTGQTILQFASGEVYGVCRYVTTVTLSGDGTRYILGLSAPLTFVPQQVENLLFFSRIPLTTSSIILPIATASILGGIKVGSTLTVAPDGTLNVGPSGAPVISVNGKIGAVVLDYQDLGLATVAQTGSYNDLIDKPVTTLPVATTTVLGGVKAPSGLSPNLVIAPDGTIDLSFAPVKSVRNQGPDASGNIDLQLSGFPDAIALGTIDADTVTANGLYFGEAATVINAPAGTSGLGFLEVVAANPSSIVQAWTSGESIYTRRYTGGAWTVWSTSLTIGALASLWNTPTFPPSLSDLPDPHTPEEYYEAIRIAARQLPLEAYTYEGFWNPVTNVVNGDPAATILANGRMTISVDDGSGSEVANVLGIGRVFTVTTAGFNTIDGNSQWRVGDVIFGLNNRWVCLRDAYHLLTADLVGAVDGLCPLDENGYIPLSYLPATVYGADNYQGDWDVVTNTPDITTGSTGQYWKVVGNGIFNFGGGDITFYDGDYVHNYAGGWVRRRDVSSGIVPSLQVLADLGVMGGFTAEGASIFNGITTYNNAADFNGAVDMASTLNVSGLATLNSLQVTGTSNFVAAATFASTATFNDYAQFTQQVDFSGPVTHAGTEVFSGQVQLQGKNIIQGYLTEVSNLVTHAVAGALALTLPMNVQRVQLNANITSMTIAAGTLNAGEVYSKTLIIINGGAFTVVWPAGTKWPDGNAPALSGVAGKIDVITLTTYDQGTTWLGFVGGKNF